MAPDTGLLVEFTPQQTAALQASLRGAGFDDGVFNQSISNSHETRVQCLPRYPRRGKHRAVRRRRT